MIVELMSLVDGALTVFRSTSDGFLGYVTPQAATSAALLPRLVWSAGPQEVLGGATVIFDAAPDIVGDIAYDPDVPGAALRISEPALYRVSLYVALDGNVSINAFSPAILLNGEAVVPFLTKSGFDTQYLSVAVLLRMADGDTIETWLTDDGLLDYTLLSADLVVERVY